MKQINPDSLTDPHRAAVRVAPAPIGPEAVGPRLFMIEVLLAEDDEVVETFLFDRLDEAFDEGIRVRCSVRTTLGSHAMTFQSDLKTFRELRVTIMLQERYR